MNKLFLMVAVALSAMSCKKDKTGQPTFTEDFVQLPKNKLATYAIGTNSKYLIVFEAGMGDDHTVWQSKKTAEDVSSKMDVVMYDRAGYGKSTADTGVRSLVNLRTDLEAVVNKYANGRKVVLVGHSWGGLIIRDYAIKNPTKVAGLVFVDPSHENYNTASQGIENQLLTAFTSTSNTAAANEAKQFVENLNYAAQLPNLPNVPVVVLTSMQLNQANNASDQAYGKTRQDFYNAHESLKNGVAKFTHIATTNAGHYIMLDEPAMVNDKLQMLLAMLP